MPIKVEKKLIEPVAPPTYEEIHHPDPERPQAKVLPWWIVFSRGVFGGETITILASSQLEVRGYRLSVDPVIAPHFQIRDIRVGKNSYCINGHDGVAATLFPPIPDNLSPEERLDYEELLKIHLDAAQIGQTLGLTVTNRSRQKHHFSAILWAYAVD